MATALQLLYNQSFERQFNILDGSFSSELRRKIGIDMNPLFILKNYAKKWERLLMQQIHLEFLHAGANVIRTNTFQADLQRVDRYFSSTVDMEAYFNMIKHSVLIAREAINMFCLNREVYPTNYYVLGSCGSSTSCTIYEPANLNRDQLKSYHRTRIHALLKSGIDALILESIETAEEAFALMELIKEYPSAHVLMTFKVDDIRVYSSKLSDGADLIDTARIVYSFLYPQILAMGINCVGPEFIGHILKQFSMFNNDKLLNRNPTVHIPLIACPKNTSELSTFSSWNPILTSTEYPASEWIELGVRYMGGCCNVTSSNIAKICYDLNTYYITGLQT